MKANHFRNYPTVKSRKNMNVPNFYALHRAASDVMGKVGHGRPRTTQKIMTTGIYSNDNGQNEDYQNNVIALA